MKVFGKIMKIVAALAAVAGVVYVIATYGDKIVAWAKGLLGRLQCYFCKDECCCESGDCCDCDEPGCCCDCECDEPTPEACAELPAEEEAVQAEETDFEG